MWSTLEAAGGGRRTARLCARAILYGGVGWLCLVSPRWLVRRRGREILSSSIVISASSAGEAGRRALQRSTTLDRKNGRRAEFSLRGPVGVRGPRRARGRRSRLGVGAESSGSARAAAARGAPQRGRAREGARGRGTLSLVYGTN